MKRNRNVSPFSFLCNRKRTARARCWSTCDRCCRWCPTTSSRQTTPARTCWSARCSRCGSAGSTWLMWAACRRLPWWRTASWAAPCHSRPGSWTWCTTNRNRRPPRSYRSGVRHISAGQLRDTQYTVDHDRTRQDANVDDEHARHITAGRSLDRGRMAFVGRLIIARSSRLVTSRADSQLQVSSDRRHDRLGRRVARFATTLPAWRYGDWRPTNVTIPIVVIHHRWKYEQRD